MAMNDDSGHVHPTGSLPLKAEDPAAAGTATKQTGDILRPHLQDRAGKDAKTEHRAADEFEVLGRSDDGAEEPKVYCLECRETIVGLEELPEGSISDVGWDLAHLG